MLSSRQNINMILIHTYKFFSLFAPLAISYCQFMTLLSLVVVVSFFSTFSLALQRNVHIYKTQYIHLCHIAFHAEQHYFDFVTHAAYTKHTYNRVHCIDILVAREKKTLTINRKHALNSGKRIYYWFAEANAHASHL